MNARLFSACKTHADAMNAWYTMSIIVRGIEDAITNGNRPQRWMQHQLKRMCLSMHDRKKKVGSGPQPGRAGWLCAAVLQIDEKIF